jgi:hypothetical protein
VQFQITYDQFDSLTILSEAWLEESIKQQALQPVDSFNIGLLFKIFTQGDRTMFYVMP